jgi:hypothetical protein
MAGSAIGPGSLRRVGTPDPSNARETSEAAARPAGGHAERWAAHDQRGVTRMRRAGYDLSPDRDEL